MYSGLALCLALAAGFRGPGALAGATSGGNAPALAAAEPKAPRLATIDLAKLVIDQFKNNPGYAAARDVEQQKMKPLQYMLDGMKSKLEKMDQKSPEFQQELPLYQQKYKEMQDAEQALSVFASKQVAQATAEISASAKKIADANGYTHVFVSRTPEAELLSTNPEAALGEALQRIVLVGETGTDLTELVRADLKIPAAAPTPPMSVTPVGPITPTPAPAGSPAPTTPPK